MCSRRALLPFCPVRETCPRQSHDSTMDSHHQPTDFQRTTTIPSYMESSTPSVLERYCREKPVLPNSRTQTVSPRFCLSGIMMQRMHGIIHARTYCTQMDPHNTTKDESPFPLPLPLPLRCVAWSTFHTGIHRYAVDILILAFATHLLARDQDCGGATFSNSISVLSFPHVAVTQPAATSPVFVSLLTPPQPRR